MKIINSNNKIKVVSFSVDVAICAPGQTITVVAKLKNVSGAAINKWNAGIGVNSLQFVENSTISYLTYVVGDKGNFEQISWNAGATKTFTWIVTLADDIVTPFLNYGARSAYLLLQTRCESSLSDYYTSDVVVLNTFFNPTVKEIDFVRSLYGVPHDEGSDIMSTIQIEIDKPSSDYVFSPTCTLRFWEKGSNEKTERDLTQYVNDFLKSYVSEDLSIIYEELPPQLAYIVELEFGDDYEGFVFRDEIPNAFANFALSETGTGASFGMFPRSTSDNPMLESDYPIVPYKGIAGVNIYDTNGTIVTESGMWIEGEGDNKVITPIYSVTVMFNNLTASGRKEIPLGIDGSLVGRIVSIEGMFGTTDGTWMSLMQSNETTNNNKYHIRTQVLNVGVSGSEITLRLIAGEERTATGGHAKIAFTMIGGNT